MRAFREKRPPDEADRRKRSWPLLRRDRGHVAVLTLSRPEARNAWDEDYNEGLETELDKLEKNHEVRCVILTGDERQGLLGRRQSRRHRDPYGPPRRPTSSPASHTGGSSRPTC